MRYTTRIIVPPKVRRSGLVGGRETRYAPQAIGVRKSFGFGDWLGLCGAGQVRAAAAHREWAPFLAQQSGAEAAATGRGPREVMRASTAALERAAFRQPWGADADRLRLPLEVEEAAEAGFPYFTIDPGEFVEARADTLTAPELEAGVAALVLDGVLPENWSEPYVGKFIDLPGDVRLELTLEPVHRAAVKFARAIQHCVRMREAVARACHGRPFEIEVCLDAAGPPTSPLEHLFVGLELEARQVRVTSLGLRFAAPRRETDGGPGESAAAFEERLRGHAAVARFCGPYKLSFREEDCAPELRPAIGRLCGEELHFKTAGTSYLETLRTLSRVDPALFAEIVRYSGQAAGVRLPAAGEGDMHLVDRWPVRRALLAACGAVLEANGHAFRAATIDAVTRHSEQHDETVAAAYESQFRLLSAG